jgi:predicted nucleotidyltransferase
MNQQLYQFFLDNNIFAQVGVEKIGVFGSYSRGEKYNDIDLLLDEDPGYQKRELLKNIVEEQMHVPCDVVVKDKLEPIILYYINKDLVYVQAN